LRTSTELSVSRKIDEFIEEKRNSLIDLSDTIWEYTETRFEEYQSAKALADYLEKEGFLVERDVGGIETAFIASYGSGKPVIALLGEYDALSGMSQKEGITNYQPIEEGGNGHGCGHNLLGTAPLAAVLAVKKMMKEYGLSGTIRYYGCPGEEGGSGKTFMVREGLFDDVDSALTWHPGSYSGVFSLSTLANYQVYFQFKGTSSHAANSPHLGRSALDAVELMNIGVNYLREHIISDARIHYAVTNTGGFSPNVVQSDAEVLYLIRAPQLNQVKEIYERVINIAKGAALMTGTEMVLKLDKACSNYIPNQTLAHVLGEKMKNFGLPKYTHEEMIFAKAMSQQITKNDKLAAFTEISKVSGEKVNQIIEKLGDKPFFEEVFKHQSLSLTLMGSTDVGDVSWVVPTAQFWGACFVAGTPLHSWQLVSQGKTALAHKGMLQAAKVLADAAVELFINPTIIEKAKQELEEEREGAYESPIPREVKPSPLKK
jgi:aminobenzoyl-glutamate utilization protein B